MNAEKLEGEFDLRKEETKPNESEIPTTPHKDPIPLKEEKKPESKKIHSQEKGHKKPHFFSSIGFYPDGFTFENQKEDEEIIFFIRRHFITNVPWIVGSLFLAALPAAIIPLLPFLDVLSGFSASTRLITTLFYYLVLFGFILYRFSMWYFHIGIITNIRIVDVDVSGLLTRNVAETKLEQIEDVSYTQVGVIRSIFHYGDVSIQTAGTQLNFEFDKAPNPSNITRTIGDLIGSGGRQ